MKYLTELTIESTLWLVMEGEDKPVRGGVARIESGLAELFFKVLDQSNQCLAITIPTTAIPTAYTQTFPMPTRLPFPADVALEIGEVRRSCRVFENEEVARRYIAASKGQNYMPPPTGPRVGTLGLGDIVWLARRGSIPMGAPAEFQCEKITRTQRTFCEVGGHRQIEAWDTDTFPVEIDPNWQLFDKKSQAIIFHASAQVAI